MRYCLPFLLLLLLPGDLAAQDNFLATHYTIDDGLSQSSVWSIIQDDNGFMWMGTSDGLCRFDGFKFTVYRNDPNDSTSICGNRDHRLYNDREGRLWVACFEGISVYDPAKDNFTTILRFKPQNVTDSYNTILGEDSTYLWAVVYNYGLVKINKRTYKYERIIKAGKIDMCTDLFGEWGFIDKDEIWMCGKYYDLIVYNIETGNARQIRMNKEDHSMMRSVVMNLNDSEVLGGGFKYVYLIKKNDLSYKRILINREDSAVDYVLSIFRESPFEITLNTAIGVFYFDPVSKKITRHIKSFTPEKTKYTYVQCLYKDKSGNIWIGTNGEGVLKITSPYKQFKYYKSHSDKGSLVKSIYVSARKVYIGYYENGLEIFDRDNIRPTHKKAQMPNTINYNFVYAISQLDSNTLFLNLMKNNEIVTYNIHTGKTISIVPLLMKVIPGMASLTNNHPFLLKTSDNIVYANYDQYLIALNELHSNVVRPKVIHRFDGEMLTCAFEDGKHILWLGSLNGVFYYQNNVWQRLWLPENVEIKTICGDLSGNLWIGTVRGIYVIDRAKKIIAHYTQNSGLVNQFIYGILCDDDGNIWFSHNKGLSEYITRTKKFRDYTKEDGLQSNEFNTGAYYKAADGELFFGGVLGTNSFYPPDIRDNPNKPITRITSIRMFDTLLKTNTAYWQVQTLTFPYTDNSLSFEFAALEYTNPQKNQYAYIMEGLDGHWINSGDKRFARYPGMPPGKYAFKVKASNNDGIWQDLPGIISITITPPFWQMLWFRFLCGVLFFVCTATVIVWIQKQRYRKQMRALELHKKIQLERERISRDLHDSVGTQLSLISNNIEWIEHPLKAISEDEKKDKLHFVNQAARGIISTLRETIWALNKEQISLEEFTDKLKVFAHKQLTINPEIELNFTEEITEDVILGPSEALNLFRICQEAMANALKYSGATIVKIKARSTIDNCEIIIADNGKGFDIHSVDPATQNGLENMRYRAADISYTLSIETEINKGTTVRISKK
jgi:signal transduction histidine kinase/ligand-binding sensor domain-containing protein